MPWTISRFEPDNADYIDAYLATVGRALCIATHFEDRIHEVLRVIRITDAARDGKDHNEIREIALGYRKKLLAATIHEVGNAEEIHAKDVEILTSARESRNYIAHKAASLGPFEYVKEADIAERFALLVPHIRNVAAGENLVSRWSYEICEREPAPAEFCISYPERVLKWVLGNLADFDE